MHLLSTNWMQRTAKFEGHILAPEELKEEKIHSKKYNTMCNKGRYRNTEKTNSI